MMPCMYHRHVWFILRRKKKTDFLINWSRKSVTYVHLLLFLLGGDAVIDVINTRTGCYLELLASILFYKGPQVLMERSRPKKARRTPLNPPMVKNQQGPCRPQGCVCNAPKYHRPQGRKQLKQGHLNVSGRRGHGAQPLAPLPEFQEASRSLTFNQ